MNRSKKKKVAMWCAVMQFCQAVIYYSDRLKTFKPSPHLPATSQHKVTPLENNIWNCVRESNSPESVW